MPSIEEHPVLGVLHDMQALIASKASDYADNENVYSNFEGAARLTGLSVPQVFHVMIGIKMERLRQMMSGKEPNFESMEDTIMDAANYLALWAGYERMREGQVMQQLTLDLDFSPWYSRTTDDGITGVPI